MRIRGEAGSTRAFTLLEIMVAVAVVAIMMTFLLTIFVGTMRLRRRTEEVTELNARARAAFDLLRRDQIAEQAPVDIEAQCPGRDVPLQFGSAHGPAQRQSQHEARRERQRADPSLLSRVWLSHLYVLPEASGLRVRQSGHPR